jgi:flagellar basal body-associated protein FliL
MKKGQVIIIAVFVLVIVAFLGMVVVSMLSTESSSAVKNLHGIQALNIAEGGMWYTMTTKLARDNNWSDNVDFGPINLGAGSFTVHYVSKASKNCVIEITGTVQGVSRKVSAEFKQGGLPFQFYDYGVYGGTPTSIGDTVTFYNDSKIIGNFFYFGPIRILGSRPPACQTEGVIKSYSIDPPSPGGIPNYYASWEAITTLESITFDNTYYDNMLTIAASNAASSLNLSGTSTMYLNNKTYWYRSIQIEDDAIVYGPGTLCATAMPSGSGNFELNDNAKLIGKVVVVARGDVDINNYATTAGTIEIIALQKFDINHNATPSTEGGEFYSRSTANNAFVLNNSAVARGCIICPYGDITCYTNTQIKGLAYGKNFGIYDRGTLEGGAVFLEVGNFYNRSMVIQNPSLLPPNLPPGLSSETTVTGFGYYDWDEVY